ncbi:MAG TPA: hypothetical protein VLD58_11205 [Gemmatimonadales bacterium]|nr:hypothetical protein [Gemmatimonadales bacterium]
MIVAWRRALSSPLEEEEIDWPPGWRLPSAGDSVHLSGNRGGFVESIDFDIGRQAIRVNIR